MSSVTCLVVRSEDRVNLYEYALVFASHRGITYYMDATGLFALVCSH